MSTITLPNIRVSSDLTVELKLKDGGVAIDWSTLSNIRVCIYSDVQHALAGRCTVAIDETDSTVLVCQYAANKPQYLGVNRVIVQATYMGETKTYDKPALNFVRWTDDQEGEEITITDPDIDVEIEVEDVSSSILNQAIAAALQAAEDAEHAAHLIPNQVLLDCEQATSDANAAAAAANAAGITSVQVSVEDNEPGTPSAECSLANKVLSVIFHYLKGEAGDAAGFGAITATVDDVVGDPSVTVTASGPDTAKVLAFAFHGLRGIQGVPGVANAKYKQVDTLPTASADTMDFIYLTPSGTSGVYDMSYTEQDGSTFTWRDLGTTAIQLSDYATKAELSQLDLKLNNLAMTRYYGVFTSYADLPEDATELGYAYVGASAPFAIYEFDGEDWVDTGATINGVQGEPGVGFDSVETPTPEDGTAIITLSNGDTITLDLNHNHDSYYSNVVGTDQPVGGFLPDVAYNLGEISGTVTFTIASAVAGQLNHYFWMFSTGASAPTVTFPVGVTWAAGSAPTVAANKHYEISILGGIAYYSEV